MMRPRLIKWLIMGDQGSVLGEICENLGILSVVIQTIGELSQAIDGDGHSLSLYRDRKHDQNHCQDQEYGQHLIHEVFLQILRQIKIFRIWY